MGITHDGGWAGIYNSHSILRRIIKYSGTSVGQDISATKSATKTERCNCYDKIVPTSYGRREKFFLLSTQNLLYLFLD
ncbi:hypothetical protein MPTK1_1g22430 [Marchantia polymorpha subsp. ruderalis]|uniref:Uncharacterized protein n=2 Tax=Marchantia polymorpha TaxID=3197 RepID=A0AAF6AT42_MARPO|nr:hypothetical protein MARPO_0118s0044 [Marchantia polymorpha]BBM99612.1 hypothetical protein Mp_1g22430 [Marchantia polymorpha subsp. ruderalis]|eukprot:PTQ30913.1 hypothetical protein MARPO_0118s0044 [Marchantia polymorpha]